MHYVRFLKQPKWSATRQKGSHSLTCVVTITTDLGESFYPQKIQLRSELTYHARDGKVLQFTKTAWHAGMRALRIEMVVHSITVQDQFRVHVGIVGSGTGLQPDSLCAKNLPYIVSAWSGITSSPRQSSEPSSQSAMVQREFVDLQGRSLTIWEDTGESIARHIWDAGLVLTSWLINIQSFQTGGMHELANLFRDNGHGRTNVLELGTGCGIVGIGLAQLLPRCQLLLTDLPDAKEVVEMNIAANSPATASRIAFAELDWDSSLPHCVQKSHFDLILVSDCTYNPGSAGSLVKTLVSLVSISPDAAILLASKTRHSSEKVFFDLMEDAMLRKFEHVVIPLPNAGEDNGTVMQESVQIFTFRSGRGRDSEFSSP